MSSKSVILQFITSHFPSKRREEGKYRDGEGGKGRREGPKNVKGKNKGQERK